MAEPHLDFFDRVVALEHSVMAAARRVYHHVMAIENDILKWEETHPALQPLLKTAISIAESALLRLGVPAKVITIVAPDIIAALRGMATVDPSVFGADAPSTRTSRPVLTVAPTPITPPEEAKP